MDIASTQIYSRLDIDPVRDSVLTATRAIFAAGGLLQKADVVPIKKKSLDYAYKHTYIKTHALHTRPEEAHRELEEARL